MKFIALLENAEYLEAGSDDARSERVGEEVRTAPLPEKVNDFLAAGGKSAHCSAECLSERSGVDVNPAVCVGEFAYSVSSFADDSGGM